MEDLPISYIIKGIYFHIFSIADCQFTRKGTVPMGDWKITLVVALGIYDVPGRKGKRRKQGNVWFTTRSFCN